MESEPISGGASSGRASTFAARRIDIILGRVYSIVLGLSTAEMTINALHQRQYLVAPLFWLTLGSVLATVIGLAVSNWFLNGDKIWYTLHLAAVVTALVFWQFQVKNQELLPKEFTPWVWWGLGMAALSAGFGLSARLSAFFIAVIPIWFVFLRISPEGGSSSLGRALQDAVYTFLISAVFTALVLTLKRQAAKQDQANLDAQSAAASTAAKDAIQRERLELAQLVQRQVIAALDAAAEAKNSVGHKRAKELASLAIEKLQSYGFEDFDYEATVSVGSLFSAITESVRQQAPSFKITTDVTGKIEIPSHVSLAINEATMQAVNNSMMHAGSGPVERLLSLKATERGLKIVIKDNGVGFSPRRIPKDRVGYRIMIDQNMQAVGGQVKDDSAPGKGATVILLWENHD